MNMAPPTQEGASTLSVINHPPARLPGPNLLHLLVADRSQDGQPAIDFLSLNGGRETLSYSELHHASENLALRIAALLGPDATSKPFVVPVLVQQHPTLYVAILAILKAGGAFCPLNLDIPVERARFILQDVSARIVITTSELSSKLPGGQSCLFVDEGVEGPLPVAKHRQPSREDLAYVMYTSGSTGTPKGVGISHDAVTQSLLAHDRHIPQFSRFLQFAAPTFDVSVFEIFFPLFRGKTLVSCTRQAMLNDLPSVIRQMDVDACELTPSVAGSLLRSREKAPRLRLLLTIGEMLTQPIIEEFGGSDKIPSMLWGMYGPTEAAIHCTLQPAFACSSPVRNIGVPLDTVSSFVLAIPEDDTTGQEFEILPRGEIGELAVGGYQLADGYLNRPEQMSSAFINTPYGRLYRTGDKARMLPDGLLECLGRISDGQVKLRGQRMELGEVEHAALRTSGCHSAVAAIVNATLVLFCAVDKSEEMAARIAHSCQQWLPGFMLPGDIVVLESFPRLPSGKIDRKSLVAHHRAKVSGAALARTVQYRDDVEQQLCELASRYLETDVDPEMPLSKVGLDSLTAIGLASALRRAGHRVGAIDVLGGTTISGLYSALLSAPESEPSDLTIESLDSLQLNVSDLAESHPSLSRCSQLVKSVAPCTPLQAAMLAETMANPQAYCNWVELSFAGCPTDEDIRSWFVQLGNANDILRTGFVHHRNQFWQVTFEAFAASNISTTRGTEREFEMRDDGDFLCPFRVQIGRPTSGDNRTVVVQLHHAVYDGWSTDLMAMDLAKLMRGEAPERRTQFQQLTAYYQSARYPMACDVAREFWAGNLHSFQPAALPTLNPNLESTSGISSSTVPIGVNPQRAKEVLSAVGCGPQTVFQAALAWLWGSVTGSQDVVVGTVHSGRTLPVTGIEDVMGPCIAVVPLRTDLSHVRTVRDLLVNIQAGNRATLQHSDLSLSEIKKAAGVRPAQPLYDVLFAYQETLHSRGARDSLVDIVAQQDYLETKLLVEVEPGAQDFVCRFTYHSNVVSETFISFVADSISVLVPYLLGRPNSDIGSLSTAFPSRLLSVYNPKPSTFSGVPDLAHAVEGAAAKFPDRDALCFAERIDNRGILANSISFAELNATADQISFHLLQNGVGSGGVVAIIMEKSIRLYAGILAILKAGCAYLPLLPNTPIARVETILRQAKVDVSLVDTAARVKLEGSVRSAFIDLELLDLQHTPAVRLGPRQLEPSRLAYIIYTSGSTGVPKGVCVTQLNIMSNLDVLSRIYPANPGSRLLQSCSQAFDVSVFEIFFAWTQGMCLCSGTNDTLFEDLERSIRELGITHLSMTPTVASLIEPDNVPSVQFLVTAGEAMTEAVARKWNDKLYQGYGPSETTNICSVKKMGPKQVIRHLGWSFENTSTFVLATDGLHPVPFGCLGEFCFGGDQVAQGYLGMDELTSAKFVHHPDYGRIYRSGDLGRMLPDGSMVIVGRTDEQIKIRGQRVELSEITETIRQSDNVADCTTMLLRGSETGAHDQIVSYLVPRSSQATEFRALDPDDGLNQQLRSLYHLLSSRLSSYMVPSAIVPISLLPTTPSGKLDRTRLAQAFPRLDHGQLSALGYGVDLHAEDEGCSAVETQIAEVIAESLHVSRDKVHKWTPLTMLGLDSISAIQVSRDLRTKLGRRFPISVILQNTSVARLAKSIPGDASHENNRTVVDLLLPKQLVTRIAERLDELGKPFSRILPCTPLQEAMLATSSAHGRYLNRMLFRFRVHGALGRLKKAWDVMSVRHDILRTCFVTTDEAQWPFLQIVLQQHNPVWREFGTSYQNIDDCIQQHVEAVASALDSMEPAVSFATITEGDKFYFSLVCHHALYDGVAIERLMHEVEGHLKGIPLPPPPSYEQFLYKALTLPESTDNYWRQHLAGYEPRMTADLSWDSEPTNRHLCRTEMLLDMPLSQIMARVRELGVSLLALTQSAWASTLGRIFQANDVCFGNIVNGRSLPVEGINELVAPCFNTLPVRMNLASTQRSVDILKHFHKLNTEIMPYQFTPLRRIQSILSQHGGQRLFDTILLLQQTPRALDPSLWALERDEGEMDVPLVVEVIPDTRLDRLAIKMHTLKRCDSGVPHLCWSDQDPKARVLTYYSQGLRCELMSSLLDLLLLAFEKFLTYPGSPPTLDDIPQGLEKTGQIQIRQRQFLAVAHDAPDLTGTGEIWAPTEIAVRRVLTTLSSQNPKRIQRHTTIYQLGLDSISAVQLASMLQKIGFCVAASDVIEHPTCESLARYIDARRLQADSPVTCDLDEIQIQLRKQFARSGLSTEAVETFIPCTPLQSSMMAQFTTSGGRDYFNFIAVELTGGWTPNLLRQAWLSVCRTHDILRTAIVPVEHDACAFAMLQYRSNEFDPSLTTIPEERVESFDLEGWRLGAARMVAQSSHERLWAIVIVQGKESATMHLAIHHVLYDAQSLQTVLDDLAKAARGNQLIPGTRTEEVVADILGQISVTEEHSTNFWTEQANRIVINAFPMMTPLRQESRSIRVQSAVSSVPLTTLEQAASRAGYPLQVILQAAWTRVLSAYLGEDSVVFGVVLSGRNTELTRNAVFPCITTLPIISTNDDSNRSLLVQMQRYNTGLFKQQHQPLTRIQQWLGYPETRLFDTLLVYQKLHQGASEVRHWRIVDESANIDYPVSLGVEHAPGDQLEYQITFFSDVLDDEQAQLLLQQFSSAVQHLAIEPDGYEAGLSVARPDLFSILPPEIPQIPTPIKFLHQFVECQALRTPDATALCFVERFDGDAPVAREWSYKELNDNANKVARMVLQYANVGDIVAVCFEKCPEAYFSICGILKAGCAFVALDPGAPIARNEFILQDSEAKALLIRKSEPFVLDIKLGVYIIELDEMSLASGPETAEPPELSRDLEPNDVCYCLYTSGTTGTPKGCEITHDNAVQCMLAFRHIFESHWDKDSRWLQFASLHFDVSVLEQYWSWSAGIALVAAPRDLVLEDLAGFISRLQITHIDLTPSLARLLHPDDVPSLCRGVFITGGESLKQEILDVWGSKGVIYNFYGPTEATIGVTVYPRVPTTGRASNIGKQFVNVGSYVLKPGTEQPVLKGGVGELCVSGRLVGKGYLKRVDLTAAKFPVLKEFGERVYRTGDLVRVLHGGCYDFLGRADDQVKLRGQRLEIGEINHTIRREVAAVEDVATMVVRNEAQQKDLLVSFIVRTGKQKSRDTRTMLQPVKGSAASELCRQAREACRARLPGYMVPTYVLQLPFIPLSSNNKAETKQLRKLFSSLEQDELVLLSTSDDASKVLSATGMRIAKVIAEMQKTDPSQLSSDSNIFELGIDSISVLRLSRTLKRQGLTQATPSTILRHSAIGDLAGLLEERNGAYDLESAVAAARQLVQACAHKHRSHVCEKLGISLDQIEYIAPCSPLQQGMLSRAASDGSYFNTFRFVLPPETSAERLRKAFQSALDTLPILRTRFVSTTDGFVQVALTCASLPWTAISLGRSTSADEIILMTREAWMKENQEVFCRPLKGLLMGGEKGHLLALHIFHGLYDASSLKLIMDRVAANYLVLSGKAGAPNSSVVVAPSFLEALCRGPLLDFSSSRSFWMEHVGTSISAQVSVPQHGSSVINCRRRVSFETLERLRRKLRVTHQTLVQAAWAGVLAKHGTAGSIMGIVVSGRNIDLEDADKVVGPMFNTLPFCARIHEELGATWKTLIQHCHDFNTAVLSFQHVPLRDIQKWCSNGKAMFDALFSFQRDEAVMANDMGVWKLMDTEPTADYPLALEAVLSADGWLLLELVAQKGKDEPDTLSSMMDQLELALEAMTANPEQTVMTSDLLAGVTKNTNSSAQSGVPAPNGLSAATQLSASSFIWTKTAMAIRDEMAALAMTEPDSVTESSSIYGLGLDSIDTIKLSARLRKRGIAAKVSDLIRSQTIRGILEKLESRNRDAEEHQPRPKAKHMHDISAALQDHAAGMGVLGSRDIVLPVTPLQESMIIEMIESDFRLYFNHDILELAPEIEMSRLRSAWSVVVAGSPVLRTRFLPIDTPTIPFSYCQIIGPDPTVHIREVSLDSHDELTKVCETATLRAHKGAGQSNLVQLVFATIKHQRFLVISIAHALYDGLSLDLIYRDVRLAYEGSYQALSTESYVNQVESVLNATQQLDSGRSFWSEFLQGATPTLFPQRKVFLTRESTIHREELISSLLSSEVATFCKSGALTSQALGQACWAGLLAAETQTLDVTFGVVLSCRDTESLEDLPFPTMNTVLVRSVLHGTGLSWLQYMQENINRISAHQHFPLGHAQKLAQANGPLFNTLFIQQRRPSSPPEHEDGHWMKPAGGSSAVEYPICVEVEMVGSQLIWRMACEGSYASQNKTRRMLSRLDQLLVHLVRSPEANVVRFSGPEVSICNLPPVTLQTTAGTSVATEQDGTEEQDDWHPLEATIRDILAEVSGMTPATISKRSNIYHLGLDSISAIKAVSLLRKEGFAVGLRDILKPASISDMARLVMDAPPPSSPGAGGDGLDEVPNLEAVDMPAIVRRAGIEACAVQDVLPATPMQVHMLSVWQNTQGEVFYPCFRYTLHGPVDANNLSRAWRALVTETPILRTVFVSTTSRSAPVLQVVLKPSALEESLEFAENTASCSKMGGSLSQPYHSLRVSRVKQGSWHLQLRIHHAMYDAVSLPTIMDRFASLCQGGSAGTPDSNSCEARRIGHGWDCADNSRVARQQFWTKYLAGAESALLTLSSTTMQASTGRISAVRDSALCNISGITERCRARGVSLQALFFAAYAECLVSRAVGSGRERPRCIVFGIYLANRGYSDDLETGTYPTLRLVPLRVELGRDGASLLEAAGTIQQDLHVISSPGNIDAGLWEIKDWTGVVIDSFVNFLGVPSGLRKTIPEDQISHGRQGIWLELAGEETAGGDLDPAGPGLTQEDYNEGEENARGLAGNLARDAYPDTVDVEVLVKDDEMTIGIFGSGQRFSGQRMDEMIDSIVRNLVAYM